MSKPTVPNINQRYPSLRTTVQWGIVCGCLLGCGTLMSAKAADGAKVSAEFRGQAMKVAWETNLHYCQDWLASKDFKTLGETAAGLVVLAEVQARQTDDEVWHKSASSLREQAVKLEAAAKAENVDQAKQVLAQLQKLATEFAKLPPPTPSTKNEAAGRGKMNALMTLIDGTYADAKTSVSRGDPQAAKYNAYMLSELGQLLSHERRDARWKNWSQQFVAASHDTALAPTTDSTELRNLLKVIRARCDDCHKKR